MTVFSIFLVLAASLLLVEQTGFDPCAAGGAGSFFEAADHALGMVLFLAALSCGTVFGLLAKANPCTQLARSPRLLSFAARRRRADPFPTIWRHPPLGPFPRGSRIDKPHR